jgi:hypothetical protein
MFSFLAESALMMSPIGGFLKGVWKLSGKVPWQIWAAIFAAIALWLGIRWHAHEVHKTFAAGYAQARSEDKAVLDNLRAQLAQAGLEMKRTSQEQRSKNDAANASIHSAADALRVQGPGAASCSRRPAAPVPAAPGQSQPASQPAGSAPAPMPAADGSDPLAAVSWRWLVGTGEQCDIERAENVSWRTAYQEWLATWERMRADAAKNAAKN